MKELAAQRDDIEYNRNRRAAQPIRSDPGVCLLRFLNMTMIRQRMRSHDTPEARFLTGNSNRQPTTGRTGMRIYRFFAESSILLAIVVGLFIVPGVLHGEVAPPVPVFKVGNASESPKLVLAERGGVPNRFIALLNPGTRPVEAEVADLVELFGGQVRRAWDSVLRGFLFEMAEEQARGMAQNPLIKGIYQDVRLPIADVLSNDIPYCYALVPLIDCEPPGFWEFNQRTFQGLPQTITCSNPDPAATGCVDNWGLDRIDGPSTARDGLFSPIDGPQGTDVHVYVLDTGIKASNLEFGGRVTGGHNGTYDEPGCSGCFPICPPGCGDDTNDYHGHGTHVAGILGGQFFGVAKDVTLHPVRFFSSVCDFDQSALVDGLNWIDQSHNAGMGTGIINLSSNVDGWATLPEYQPIREAVIDLASREDILFVQAAGNGDEDACLWGFGDENQYTPGTPEHDATAKVMIVGGSDETDGRWICESGDENCQAGNAGSNYGSCLDLFAPASHIVSVYDGDGGVDDDKATCRLAGTSMASPHVVGVAALILESEPFLASSDLRARILSNAIDGTLEANGADPNFIGTGSPNLLVQTKGPEIFSDGFETGDTSRWN